MRTRKTRPFNNIMGQTPATAAHRLKKMATSFSFSAVRLPMRTFALIAACIAVLLLTLMSEPLRFITESDEQFLERQRLYRRMRDLSRLRNERRRRYRLNHLRDRKNRYGERHPQRIHSNNSHHNNHSHPSDTSLQDKDYHRNEQAQDHTLQTRVGAPKDKPQDGIRAEKAPVPPVARKDAAAPPPPASSAESMSTSKLQIYWDDDASDLRICRIRRACVAKDGAVIVPGWMARHADVLESCGIIHVRYFKTDSEWNATSAYGDFDLFGYKPLRYHIPHFVTDLLPVLYAYEVLRPTFSPKSSKHRSCLTPRGICTDTLSDTLAKEKLNIALYTNDRVSTMKGDAWVPMLVKMMQSKPALAFPETIFDHSDTACFRSVVAYAPHAYVRPWRGWYGPKHPLFAKNKISRNSVIRPPDSSGACRVQLTILNRFGWVERGGYLVGRDITNVDEIMANLDEAQKVRGLHAHIKLDVSVEYFENTDFREQVAIMQKADVILGVHGAGLGNLLFARMDVPFVEVFPFGYYAGPFDRLAEALNLKYRFVVADPDTKNFYECIKKRSEAMENAEVLAKALEMWKAAMKDWKNGATRVLNSHEWRGKILSPIKLCIRSQRMRLRPKETAKVLLDLADGICKRGR